MSYFVMRRKRTPKGVASNIQSAVLLDMAAVEEWVKVHLHTSCWLHIEDQEVKFKGRHRSVVWTEMGLGNSLRPT